MNLPAEIANTTKEHRLLTDIASRPPGLLAGRSAVVTGAARGIGAAIAVAFAAEGARLCLVDRAEGDGLRETADRCSGLGSEVTTVRADVSLEQDVAAAVEHALERFGSVAVLVNNAAILTNCRVAQMPAAMFDETIAVDLRSVFLCCRAVLPSMTAAGYGRIINIASQLALKGGPGLAHYSAAKAGVIGFTRALAREVADDGITVNCIAPGPIDTALAGDLAPEQVEATRLSLPLRRIGVPEEVAPTAVLLASEPGGNLYTGQTLGPNSGDVMP
jgi:3-oxoacyl-[acyl-carrier protein] reductase